MFKNVEIIKSTDDNVLKFVFTKEDAVAEAVMYKYPTYEERTVICCSTQSGCPVGCRFCGAGDHFVRSLTGTEIAYQVFECIRSQKVNHKNIKKFQIMFMSMGEPMLNYAELNMAMDVLSIAYPNAQLLISTIAPKVDYAPLMTKASRMPQIGLQFSIHQTTDEARNAIIPYPNKHTLEEIAWLGGMFWHKTNRKPFLNYCATETNSTQEDADRLAGLFNPKTFEMTISVVCERNETIKAAHDRQRELTDAFVQKLIAHGFSTRVFDPAGQDDIGGGCGQLWYVQQWMKDHPEKVKNSIGYGKLHIHAPK
jgi:23S rRNA (adenine2503-C2)-methyltransferase